MRKFLIKAEAYVPATAELVIAAPSEAKAKEIATKMLKTNSPWVIDNSLEPKNLTFAELNPFDEEDLSDL